MLHASADADVKALLDDELECDQLEDACQDMEADRDSQDEDEILTAPLSKSPLPIVAPESIKITDENEVIEVGRQGALGKLYLSMDNSMRVVASRIQCMLHYM